MDIKDINNDFIESTLQEMGGEELLKWSFDNFGNRVAIGTSFQLTGSVIVDMAIKVSKDFRVFIVDTLKLHDETYKALSNIESKYGIKVEKFLPKDDKVEDMISRFGEFLFFDSIAKQEYCCGVRKVEPNSRAVETLDVWISGLRSDQSANRKNTTKVELVEINDRTVLKINPLLDWTEASVRDYLKENNVPYNVLFDQGYDSIGCKICSTPLNDGEKPRSGRWRWQNQDENDNKECGIHLPNKGDK